MEKASSLEASGDYAGAVDAYFEVHRKAFGASPSADEKATMIKAWRAAVKLAGERVPGKTRAVVRGGVQDPKLGDAAAADDPGGPRRIAGGGARRYAPGAAAGAGVGKPRRLRRRTRWQSAASRRPASSEADALRRAAHAARSGDGATGASTLALPRGPPVDAEQFGGTRHRGVGVGVRAGGRRRRRGGGRRRRRGGLTGLVDSMRATPDVHADALRALVAGSGASDRASRHGDATEYAERPA